MVIGDKASNLNAFVIAPVPPLAIATMPVTLVAEFALPLRGPLKLLAVNAPVNGTKLSLELAVR